MALLAVSVLDAMQTDSCKLCTCTKNARHWYFEARWLEDCFSKCKRTWNAQQNLWHLVAACFFKCTEKGLHTSFGSGLFAPRGKSFDLPLREESNVEASRTS